MIFLLKCTTTFLCENGLVPNVKCGVEDVGLLQAIQLNLAVTHLVVDTLQLIVELQLLPFKLAVLFLVPFSTKQWKETELLAAASFSIRQYYLFTLGSLTVAPLCPAAENAPCSGSGPGPQQPSGPPQPPAPGPEPPPPLSAAAALPAGSPLPPPAGVTAAPDTA